MIKKCIAVCMLASVILTSCAGNSNQSENLFNWLGNRDVFDDISQTSNTWRYAVVEFNGKVFEGEIKSWADYQDSDALKIVFKDGTEVMTSYNKAVLSKSKIDWR